MADYKTTKRVNIRNNPVIAPETLMATLAVDTPVTKIENAPIDPWWKVSVPSLSITGFIHSAYLESNGSPVIPVTLPVAGIPAIDLTLKSTTASSRNTTTGRAYPLNETNMPGRNMASVESKINSIHEIISWLNVENSARYGPTETQTYCNIYAYDFSKLAGVYIPRVWWTRSAIANLARGNSTPGVYGQTVTELNANSLYDWYVEFSSAFGWKRVFSLDEIQAAATNEGKIGIIVGQRLNLNNSGHITCVVPESSNSQAERTSAGNVFRPLQSQAGRVNHKYYIGNWWSNPQKFKAFGYWVHE